MAGVNDDAGRASQQEKDHVRLSLVLKDAWDIPQLVPSIDHSENDEEIIKDFPEQGTEMFGRKEGVQTLWLPKPNRAWMGYLRDWRC
jgi:hypothetical protein